MIDKVVLKLKTGIVKNVVEFGTGPGASIPYVVVKGEKSVGGRGVRVIAHFAKDYQHDMEDYMHYVIKTLSYAMFTSRSGCVNQLSGLIDYTDVVVVNDDSTISMEALFLMPTKSF